MADNPSLNSLLKWSIRNSEASREDQTSESDTNGTHNPSRGLDPQALSELMGGPTDADRMRDSMAAIQSSEVDLENKKIAFDNLEQLVENIDNANNMESLGLWMPLVEQLQSSESDMRMYAAWCIATAVSNNPQAQERALVLNAVPTLVKLAREDQEKSVRKKSILALSSEIRNYRPGLNAFAKAMPDEFLPNVKNMDPEDMDAIDDIIGKLRKEALEGD